MIFGSRSGKSAKTASNPRILMGLESTRVPSKSRTIARAPANAALILPRSGAPAPLRALPLEDREPIDLTLQREAEPFRLAHPTSRHHQVFRIPRDLEVAQDGGDVALLPVPR